MSNILLINASAHADTSTSRKASAHIVNEIGGNIVHRDIGTHPVPFIDAAWADARLTDPETRSQQDADRLALSDTLIAELEAADTIIIGVPIYNFAAPATLKAWMDLVARPGVTFHYTSDGPVGHLTGKKVIVAVASGGVKIGSPADHLTPHLKQFLGFIGITDVEFLAAKDVIAPETA